MTVKKAKWSDNEPADPDKEEAQEKEEELAEEKPRMIQKSNGAEILRWGQGANVGMIGVRCVTAR